MYYSIIFLAYFVLDDVYKKKNEHLNYIVLYQCKLLSVNPIHKYTYDVRLYINIIIMYNYKRISVKR